MGEVSGRLTSDQGYKSGLTLTSILGTSVPAGPVE